MKLKLKKFDLSRIEQDKIVVLLGSRGKGKSFIVKDLLYHNADMPIGTCISPTEVANKFYGDIVPKPFIHHEYTPELVANVIKRQKLIIKQIEKEKKKKGHSNLDPRAFCLMDDCLYDSTWTRDVSIRSIFMNGRHYKLFYILTSQFPLGIPPILRTNIDFTFILRENIVSNRKRLYENFAGMFPTFEIFCTVLDQVTENYECMVIDNTSKSNKLEDCVYWFKASDRPNFKIGASQFWLNNHDDSDSDSDGDEAFNMSRFKKKSSIPVNVKKHHY